MLEMVTLVVVALPVSRYPMSRARSGPVKPLFSSPRPVEAQVPLETQDTVTVVFVAVSKSVSATMLLTLVPFWPLRLFQLACVTPGTPAASDGLRVPVRFVRALAPRFRPMLYGRIAGTGAI